MEVSNRGRWKQERSTARYEKAGRLGAGLKDLSAKFLDYGRTCENRLADIVLGRGDPVSRFVPVSTTKALCVARVAAPTDAARIFQRCGILLK